MTAWSKEEDAVLYKYAKLGWSSREMSKLLNGRTRNSVIGRCHRLGLVLHDKGGLNKRSGQKPQSSSQKRVTISSASKKAKDMRPRHPVPPTPAKETKLSVIINPKPLLEIKHNECRFPVRRNGDNEWLMCAEPRSHNTPYCAEHARDCYRPYQHRPSTARVR